MTIVRCAWHPMYFGSEKIIREIKDGSDLITDGMCSDCCLKWIEQDKERIKEKGKKKDVRIY